MKKEWNQLIWYKQIHTEREVSEKEEIKFNNIIKQCQKWLTLMLLWNNNNNDNNKIKKIKEHNQYSHKVLINHIE